jgi:chromate transporter
MADRKASLWSVAWFFLRLGTTAFGGPAAHIALMEEEVVRRRGWLTHAEFLDLLGAANLLPGPSSTEVAIYIGHRIAGWPGLVLAGVCFILPAALLVTAIAWAYVTFHTLPQVAGLLYGVKPVVVAVVVQALWRLGRACVRSVFLAVVGAAAVVLLALGAHELAVLFGAGLFVMLVRAFATRRRQPPPPGLLPLLKTPALPLASAAVSAAAPVGLWPLFLFFLKVGSVIFGSGYVLLAFLRTDLVERWHWLKEDQLLDAVAVGQVTPGPVFTTATFIGYVLAGPVGAAVATAGIFLPGFVFVALSVRLLPRLRKSALAGAFLDGVNVGSLALMAVVTWQLGWAAIIDVPAAVLALGCAVLLFRFRVNATWLVLGGAALGLLRGWVVSLAGASGLCPWYY